MNERRKKNTTKSVAFSINKLSFFTKIVSANEKIRKLVSEKFMSTKKF